MRKLLHIAYGVLVVGMLVACGSRAPAGPRIRVEDVWSRPAMGGMSSGTSHSGGGEMGMRDMGAVGVVYLTIVNDGGEADRLVGARSDVAQAVELHQTQIEGGVMRMQPVAGGVEIPARGRVVFEPGGYHIMLIGLKRDLKPGDRFKVTLQFEKSGALTVESEVRGP